LSRILGVDPGLTRCGFGVITSNLDAVEFGVITSAANQDPRDRVGKIATELEAIIARTKPSFIAIERVFAQQNLRSVMGVAQISGALMAIAHRNLLPVHFYTPTEVKAAVSGSGRADKAQVGEMVRRALDLDAIPKPADTADALAVAICAVRKGVAGTNAQQQWVAASNNARRK
jgi:crossover junction endodeoxyribonuclease RuvC